MISEDVVLAVKIPSVLREMIDYVADQRGQPVADVVLAMLEEIVEIERVRKLSRAQALLEQRALFGTREAKRAAATAWEDIMAAWRRRHEAAPEPAVVSLTIEAASPTMEELAYLADRRGLSLKIYTSAMVNEIVDLEHERLMSDEEAALRQRAADPELSVEQRLAARRKALAIWQAELAAWREKCSAPRSPRTKAARARRGKSRR